MIFYSRYTRVRPSLIMALFVCSLVPSYAAEKDDGNDLSKAALMERCQTMRREHQKMTEDMRAQDADLNNRVMKMNAAPDDKKLALATEVITHLVEQRASMAPRMEKMQAMMMPHMMEHMQMGTASMAQCPMMKDMKGMKDMKDMDKNENNDLDEIKKKQEMQDMHNMKGGLTK